MDSSTTTNPSTSTSRYTLRAIITDDDIRKMVFQEKPGSIEELKEQIGSQFPDVKIKDCRLHYIDPDLGQYVNLMSMSDLHDKSTVKVLQCCSTSFDDLDISDMLSVSQTFDTSSEISEDMSCTSEQTSECSSSARKMWPLQFQIPKFAYETELALNKANKLFKDKGQTLRTTLSLKSDILDKLAEEILKIKAYPNDKEVESVVCELMKKWPCLKDSSTSGYQGWKQSLKFKMGNYRSKLRNLGLEEVAVNSKKRKGETASAKNIKKARKAEVNYLPEFPEEESKESLERKRVELLAEYTKKDGNITTLMDVTFALRRQEVVIEQPMVEAFKGRWPALFTEKQVNILVIKLFQITNKEQALCFEECNSTHTPSHT